MCEVEQRTLLDEKLSSVESYQRRRMGTSAVFVCLAIHEYVTFDFPIIVEEYQLFIWVVDTL